MPEEFCVKEHSLNGSRQKSVFILFFCALTKLMDKIAKGGCLPRLIEARKPQLRTLFETVT